MSDDISLSLINFYLNKARENNISITERKKALKKASTLIYDYIEYYEKYLIENKRNSAILECLCALNVLLYLGLAADKESYVLLICSLCWIPNSIRYLAEFNSAEQTLSTVKKYHYFLENEETINQEIIERFVEENKDSKSYSLNDAPVITVADIDDMDIKELQETVELIRRAH